MSYPPFHARHTAGTVADDWSAAQFRRAFPGEGDHVEFKTGLGASPLQETIVAFSNADGGVVLIGVTDAGEIEGRELTPDVEATLHQIIADVHQPGRYTLHGFRVEGRGLSVLSVAKRVEGFAQTSNGRVLVRQGPFNRALLGQDLARFVSSRSLERYEQTATHIGLDALHEPAARSIGDAFGWTSLDDVDRLREHGLVPFDGRPVLTVAGALHLLEKPEQVIPKAFVEILRYPATDAEYDRRVEIRGPLGEQVRRATEFIAQELGTDLVVTGLMRHELPRLPQVVLREAIANAVAHRSYEAAVTPVRVAIRPGEVRITSPGGLPEPVTVENMRSAMAARNPETMRLLRGLGLAEDAGRGVDVMEDTMLSELLELPEFHDLGHAVGVVLPLGGAVTPGERAWLKSMEHTGGISPRDKVLLVHAARGEALTNSRVREILRIDSVQARQALVRLTASGALAQRGERGGARYVISPDFAPPGLQGADPEEILAQLVSMAQTQPLTNARVRAFTGLDRTAAQRLLKALVTLGRLRQVGERRGVRYVPVEPALPMDGAE